jgi:hypothetical protein
MMSHARDTFGSWLSDHISRRLPNLRREFDLNRDELARRQMLDAGKTEAQRRQEQSETGSGEGGGMIRRDKPAPALKPPPAMRAQVDRDDFNGRWLAAQRDAAMANARPSTQGHEQGPAIGRIMDGPSR